MRKKLGEVTLSDGKTYKILSDDHKQLMLQNTGKFLLCDTKDWEIARHCFWYEKDGRAVTKLGMTFEDYVGIVGIRSKQTSKYDYRRALYG